jgi:UDP-N-acetylglucosamine transferase subunit ALG13
MIFVTIGSMFPFDRMIRYMDEWALAHPDVELRAQIGDGEYEPKHMPFDRKLAQRDFDRVMNDADFIVAHAGMGSVIQAAEFQKPIIILPRLRELGEHTTDHQIDTANWLRDRPGIRVVESQEALYSTVERWLSNPEGPTDALVRTAPPEFISRIRGFLVSNKR